MDNKFTKTKLASAVSAAALAMAVSAPSSAVVVVGGDNGWEVSFDGNVNAFYANSDFNYSARTAAGSSTTPSGVDENSSRVMSGYLPAFFSFNVKSPTVNGLTGSGRISFAPNIHRGKSKNGIAGGAGLEGASIDTREVLANVEGSFGTFSFGRTLSIYGRQAILADLVLFGFGNGALADAGTVTAGGFGFGYTYPFEPGGLSGSGSGAFETDTPRIEAEASYATSFQGGTVKVWGDMLWQEAEFTATGSSIDYFGWGVGAVAGFGGFQVNGYYYDGDGIGHMFQGSAAGGPGAFAGGVAPTPLLDSLGLGNTFSVACVPAGGAVASCDEASNDGFYVQGSYTFQGRTRVGVRYGESNQDGKDDQSVANLDFADVSRDMWTIGVYHDVNSWMKLIAEYNDATVDTKSPIAGDLSRTKAEWDTFAIGAFFLW
jgi:hypothetical protein